MKRVAVVRMADCRGFTIIEMAVVLFIITSISAIVLVSFTGLHEDTAINRASREVALALRQAQNMSFAITQVDTQTGPKIPPATGLRFVAGSPIFFLFADIVEDSKYSSVPVNGAVDAKIRPGEQTLEGAVVVRSLTYHDSIGSARTTPAAHVVFVAPESTMVITDGEGNALGDVLEIELGVPSRPGKKTVIVRTSGQISMR